MVFKPVRQQAGVAVKCGETALLSSGDSEVTSASVNLKESTETKHYFQTLTVLYRFTQIIHAQIRCRISFTRVTW